MVVGNGMLAKGLSALDDNGEILVFASGVSNSKETNPIAYQREFELLREKMRKYPDMKLIYFSTCSISDQSLLDSPYVNHKIHMEEYIAQNSSNYAIFRLPNVIGLSANPNTFFNFFKSKILSGASLQIQEAATRYLIDMRDISKIIPLIIRDENLTNTVTNIAFQNPMPVVEIIQLYEEILNLKAEKNLVPGGTMYVINNSDFLHFLKKNRINQPSKYNYQILEYYLMKSEGYETNENGIEKMQY